MAQHEQPGFVMANVSAVRYHRSDDGVTDTGRMLAPRRVRFLSRESYLHHRREEAAAHLFEMHMLTLEDLAKVRPQHWLLEYARDTEALEQAWMGQAAAGQQPAAGEM